MALERNRSRAQINVTTVKMRCHFHPGILSKIVPINCPVNVDSKRWLRINRFDCRSATDLITWQRQFRNSL